IPANSTLVFEVELLDIKADADAKPAAKAEKPAAQKSAK
ncbi:FKBP-type peptidyl-prolyl cis-trans isomerase FkpA, partial [Candidatus Symbiopectobacterium sp. NZEC135]|nr:FKBP-type peptidyl-prolyl cis-trans isomerase FkpA [Candidatus Symbiopectobacterium sp. NZEC135]